MVIFHEDEGEEGERREALGVMGNEESETGEKEW
jgi:hypothetical protein